MIDDWWLMMIDWWLMMIDDDWLMIDWGGGGRAMKWIAWAKQTLCRMSWRLVEAMLHIRGHHREAQEALKSEAEKDIQTVLDILDVIL